MKNTQVLGENPEENSKLNCNFNKNKVVKYSEIFQVAPPINTNSKLFDYDKHCEGEELN